MFGAGVKGKLGPIGDEVMLDTLHHAAVTAQEQNTGAAANSDFEALEKLRRLAFAEEVPAPRKVQMPLVFDQSESKDG